MLEALLGGRNHLVGEAFTLADVAYAPLVCEMEAVQLDDVLAARPAAAAWVERLRARPAVRDSSPGG